MKKINILYCVEYLNSGGTEKQLISLINEINKEKYSPHLCCLKKTAIGKSRKKEALELFDKIECPKINLDFISFRYASSWFDLIKLIKFIKRNEIDIIQTYFQDPVIIGFLAAKFADVKYLIACFRDMGFWRNRKADLIMSPIYKHFSFYIANSFSVKEVFKKAYNLDGNKMIIIPNGIDFEKYSPKNRVKKIDLSTIKIGIVANYNRKVKRVDVFLRAAEIISQHLNNAVFTLAGEGEHRSDLVQLTKELRIENNVKLLGKVEDIPGLLSSIDIGVNSSDSEGFSNSILEFMASGVPVVATDVGGNREIIQDGYNGFLIPPGDYSALASKVILLATNKNIYNNIQECALKTILKYSLNECIGKYENLYFDLFSSSSKRYEV